MPTYKNVTLAKPLLSHSQLKFRLGLVRQRMCTYPLDSMDFIMMDLERPEATHRHAYQCTGDLTGEMLLIMSCADSVDGQHDERLPELFERILQQRQPSGLFGRRPVDSEEYLSLRFASVFPAFLDYYELTHDIRALDAAIGLADIAVRSKEIRWFTEPMVLLYGLTGKKEYLDFVGLINDAFVMPDKGEHAPAHLTKLRGLQTAALITGDAAWNAKAEASRRMIIDRHFELPDGCISESLPYSARNEGCSIANWLIVNLNAGAITGDDAAYEHAEHIMWNALAFNQLISGSFGHRSISPNGYNLRCFEEAWWCCLQQGGLALVKYAHHAVTLRGKTIHINLLVPGLYRLALPGGQEAEVRITTAYPARAEAIIEAARVPADYSVRLRVPACVKRPVVTESRKSDRVRLTLSGRLGHHVERCHSGVMLKYGPLILTPAIYSWQAEEKAARDTHAPAGYIPDAMPQGLPALELPAADADGLLALSDLPQPDWMYFDDGPTSRCGVAGSPANVSVKFPDGTRKTLRFTPECYNTSNLSLFDTPIFFSGTERIET